MSPAQLTLRHLDLTGVSGSTRIATTLPQASGRPFLKWAGGKQWAAPLLASLIEIDFCGTYYEPFLGGGALFFAAGPINAQLSDSNAELVATYQAVQQNVEEVIARLGRYRNTQEHYESARRSKPRTLVATAARFIYLNKTAFNGLYRVNHQGSFNVPFGRFSNPTICQTNRLREASTLLQGRTLLAADFEHAVREAREGDIVYFDPPYITGHTNNGFHKYNAKLFSWRDQLRLGATASRLRDSGVRVYVTNAEHEDVIALYRGFHHYMLSRTSLIGGPARTRGRVVESLLTSEPVLDLATEVIGG